jgi:hypothetical protein
MPHRPQESAMPARSHQKGRSPYRPTEDDRKIVHSMVAVGFDQLTICARLGIAGKTLRKYFREDLDNAYTMLVVRVRLQIIRKADEGDTQALIFVNRVLGWNDRPPRAGSNVNVGIGLSLEGLDEDQIRAELSEFLCTPLGRALTIDTEPGD